MTKGNAIQIIKKADHRSFILDEEALKSILNNDDVKELPVAVVSVAGAFRKGKSFILDFFLRYLIASGNENWMGSDDEILDGFSWRGGSERDTTGILFWSKVFRVTTSSGQDIAVILMDTQGVFDSQSTVEECATIFALSTMISSVQIYNLMHNIQEDDLQHLQLFTEYGRIALEDGFVGSPFQKLEFLVRDWPNPSEASYGLEGGRNLLDRRLQISEEQQPELQSLRKHIRECFSDISCFLMPHPGSKIVTNPNFDGRLADIESEFKEQLETFVPHILAPENLIVKKIGDRLVKVKELLLYFKAYMEVFKGNEMPVPKSIFEATAEANNLAAMASAKNLYISSMEKLSGGNKSYMPTTQMEIEHTKCKELAIIHFNSIRKMGGVDFSNNYRTRLVTDMDSQFVKYLSNNEMKYLNISMITKMYYAVKSYLVIAYGASIWAIEYFLIIFEHLVKYSLILGIFVPSIFILMPHLLIIFIIIHILKRLIQNLIINNPE